MLKDVGYELGIYWVNVLTYADDVFLVSATSSGMELLLEAVERNAAQQGLSLDTAKPCP